MPYHRRSTRLPSDSYLGQRIYFVTICCDRRSPHLRPPAFAQFVLKLLHECAANYSFVLHAFCVMPDHLHVLAEGTHPQSNLREFIRLFKQHTAFEFRKSFPGRLWEKSYYDYILRPGDPIEGVATYIWWNPVRKHLCARPQDFALCGSQSIQWMQRSASVPTWTAPWKHPEPA